MFRSLCRNRLDLRPKVKSKSRIEKALGIMRDSIFPNVSIDISGKIRVLRQELEKEQFRGKNRSFLVKDEA